MNNRIWMSFGLISLVMASSAFAADQAPKLERQLCSVCHGRGGTTSSELFPQLAGEPAPYFINQMKAFRDKSRTEENAKRFMWGISSRLSDDDIQQLAAFYEAQSPVHLGKISDQAKYDLGRRIFTEGHAEKGVPPCKVCHGEKGEGKEATPRLGGQHEEYLKRQLKVFYGNERPAATAMHEVVKGLSEEDIEAIAQYLQAQ
ncbi:cytochrome c-552 precursor [mine drainage metagenome]|uniref:Cytochrome c-552 n=1 Tax=mine drainage metagenome TaxID=410659 RepID=A0A1J5TEW7_9ZZZZ